MTNFNITFQTKEGRIDVYEGVDIIVIGQEGDKIKIPLTDFEAFYAAVQIANKKRRNV